MSVNIFNRSRVYSRTPLFRLEKQNRKQFNKLIKYYYIFIILICKCNPLRARKIRTIAMHTHLLRTHENVFFFFFFFSVGFIYCSRKIYRDRKMLYTMRWKSPLNIFWKCLTAFMRELFNDLKNIHNILCEAENRRKKHFELSLPRPSFTAFDRAVIASPNVFRWISLLRFRIHTDWPRRHCVCAISSRFLFNKLLLFSVPQFPRTFYLFHWCSMWSNVFSLVHAIPPFRGFKNETFQRYLSKSQCNCYFFFLFVTM